jgi:hypothetical protein
VTNTKLLKKKIDLSGYKMKYIAAQLGITYYGLAKKVNNETEFKASEIQILCDLLNVTGEEKEEIFFYLICR